MEISFAVEALNALANETRLEVFLLLTQMGPEGIPAGELSARLDIPGNTLSFHLTRLRYAHLVRARKRGRHIFYSANYEGMEDLTRFLTESCCAESPDGCPPVCAPPGRKRKPHRAAAATNSRSRREK